MVAEHSAESSDDTVNHEPPDPPIGGDDPGDTGTAEPDVRPSRGLPASFRFPAPAQYSEKELNLLTKFSQGFSDREKLRAVVTVLRSAALVSAASEIKDVVIHYTAIGARNSLARFGLFTVGIFLVPRLIAEAVDMYADLAIDDEVSAEALHDVATTLTVEGAVAYLYAEWAGHKDPMLAARKAKAVGDFVFGTGGRAASLSKYKNATSGWQAGKAVLEGTLGPQQIKAVSDHIHDKYHKSPDHGL